jgi:hypothetical protein
MNLQINHGRRSYYRVTGLHKNNLGSRAKAIIVLVAFDSCCILANLENE